MKRTLLLCLCCLVFVGCQLPLANTFRDHAIPQNTATKVALAPVLLPAYTILCTVDITMVNPIRGCKNVPGALGTMWKWQNKSPWVGLVALMPAKIIATPPVVLGTAIFSEQFLYADQGLSAQTSAGK